MTAIFVGQEKPSLDTLSHHGVKGMKWGVRQNYHKIRNAPRETKELGTSESPLNMVERKTPVPAAAIAAMSPKFRKTLEASKGYDIYAGGKKVGNTQLHAKSKDELNVVWMGIDKKQRGKGYASKVFDANIEHARANGFTHVTLEVPGNAPDARHIYEKAGFIAGKTEGNAKTDPVWGGLTDMRLDLKTVKHADGPTEEEFQQAMDAVFGSRGLTMELLDGTVSHSVAVEDETFLSHHGVKGMKWGVRKEPDEHRTTEARGDRKAASHAATAYMINANRSDPRGRKMTEEKYANLSTNGATFAKGMELHRITKVNSTQMREGALYVSKQKEDADFYKAIIPATGLKKAPFMPGSFVSGGQKAYESYDVTMKTTEKLKLPSDKERVDAFMHILSQPTIAVPGKNAPITGRQYLEAHGYAAQFKNKTDQQATFSAYYQFLRTQGDKSSPINQAYFDLLKSKGYNAVLDENDAGRYSKEPLIIIDGKKSVKSTSIRRLSADEINAAQRNLRKTRPPALAAKDALKQARKDGNVKSP